MSRAGTSQSVTGRVRAVQDPVRLGAASYSLLRALSAPSPAIVDDDGANTAERVRLWRAMRVLREFDAPYVRIAAVATLAGTERLIADLVASGHLHAVEGDDADPDWPAYRVARDTGPQLPDVGGAHG